MNSLVHLVIVLFLSETFCQSSTNDTHGIHIQIFDNIAEITQPINLFDLPVTYSQREWNDIRSDSFRLIGNSIDIHSQVISYNRTSFDGQKILIQRSTQNETLTEAIMIDEKRNLIHDLVDNTYYVINTDRIRYLSIPSELKYFVNFHFETISVEQIYLRYLHDNIKWKVRYDLLLESNDTDSILQAYADIKNDGGSTVTIDFAELITGDLNIRSSSPSSVGNGYTVYNAFGSNGNAASDYQANPVSTTSPIISQSAELAGVYVYSINETFTLDPRTNYILPMFRPTIDIERYGLIEKYFQRIDNRGNAQRAYRLRVPDHYLPKGHVFVRESNRLVGEIYWSDHTANETNEFYIGEDPDLQYIEYIQLISRRQTYEANGYRFILSTYTTTLRLINNKDRSINIEYRLRFGSQDNLTLKEVSIENGLQLDGSIISGIFQLNPNDQQEITFTLETQ